MSSKSFEEVLEETGSICWKNVGVSMLPLIREGKDIMIIKKRPDCRLNRFDVVLFVRPLIEGRGRYVLHRILKVNGDGTYFIVGDNCYGGETVPEENVIGVLTSVVRNGKSVDFSRLSYKLYVGLWCRPYKVRRFIQKYYRFTRNIGGGILRKLRLRK